MNICSASFWLKEFRLNNTRIVTILNLIILKTFYFGSRNFGFIKITIEGTSSKALIKHVEIEITINKLKYRKGAKLEKESAKNPTITENALKTIPLPAVVNVIRAASLCLNPFVRSTLKRHKKCIV